MRPAGHELKPGWLGDDSAWVRAAVTLVRPRRAGWREHVTRVTVTLFQVPGTEVNALLPYPCTTSESV